MPLPVFLLLEGRACLVVGAGAIARHKTEELVREGARVTVVATELTAAWRARGALDVTLHERAFVPGDAARMTYVFAATGVPLVDDAVAADARAPGALVNAADRNPSCDFYSAAVVRRGPVLVAIGTGGTSPALARALRERIDDMLAPSIAPLADGLGHARPRLLARYPDYTERARVLSAFVGRALARLDDNTARAQVDAWIDAELLGEDEGA